FAAVAIRGANIAIQIKAPVVSREVPSRAMDREGVPEGEIARLELEIDEVRRVEPRRLEARLGHRAIHHPAGDGELDLAHAMRARIKLPSAGFGIMSIDGDASLEIGVGKVAIGLAWAAEADILVEGELGRGGARRLPMHLIDDLLDVAPEQRLEESEDARIG